MINDQAIYDSVQKTVTKNSHTVTMTQEGVACISIANGAIRTTDILFRHENFTLRVHASGTLELYDSTMTLRATGESSSECGGKGVFESVRCTLQDGKLTVCFPEYEWIDNYPHCDGESDRWDCRCIGWNEAAVFDINF